jgi:hypothetical protein
VQDNGGLVFADPEYINSSLVRINSRYPNAISGYRLAPGESVMLNYTGDLDLSNNTAVVLSPSNKYKIVVLGDFIFHTLTNATLNR